MKKLLATLITFSILGLSSLCFAVSPPDKRPPPPKDGFGIWLDKDGFIKPGIHIKNLVDTDKDGIDDRFQPEAGAPAGKPRPQKPGGGKGDGKDDGKGDGKGDGKETGGPNVHPKPPPRPHHPPRPKLSDDLQDKVDLYKIAQDALRKALKTEIDALGDDATREEIKAVAEEFKDTHKEDIEAQIAAGKALHAEIKANRPEREKIERPEPPAEVKAAAEALRAKHKELDQARHQLHKNLKDASDEERKEQIAAFKESQKEHHAELKEAKKALREAIRDNVEEDDRRSDD